MPCYQITTCSVNLDKANLDLLHKALVKEGYTVYHSIGSKTITFSKGNVTGSYRNNKLEFSYSSGKAPDTDSIKRAYSKEAIAFKAAQYADEGWELEQTGEGEYEFRRPSAGYGTTHA